jgi:PAS domain S-box-containing protein
MSDDTMRPAHAQQTRLEHHAAGPRPQATTAPAGPQADAAGSPSREAREREAAARRAALHRQRQAADEEPPRNPYYGLASPKAAERSFAALAENVRDYAIFLLDPAGTITFWGEAARLMKGWTKEEAEGAHLRLLHPDGGSEDGTAEAHLDEAAERGEYTGEGHRLRADGSTFWGGITLTALRDDDGALLGFAKVTRDMTAQQAAEAALKAAHEAAEEASRAKSLFLATISHEVRTPLTAIMAFTDILEMELAGPLNEKQRHQLGRIAASSQHLLGIVDEVLDFSRLEAGRIDVQRAAMPLGPVVEAALNMVGPQAALLADSTAIQRAIAECHGAQRFRLGWRESEVRREFEILREELAAAVRRRVHTEREAELEDAIGLLAEFLGRAEKTSLESYRTAAQHREE